MNFKKSVVLVAALVMISTPACAVTDLDDSQNTLLLYHQDKIKDNDVINRRQSNTLNKHEKYFELIVDFMDKYEKKLESFEIEVNKLKSSIKK